MSDGPVSHLSSADRASRDRTSESIVRRLLGAGTAGAARFLTSVRVGSGAATMAALDGQDGIVLSDGAVAGFFFRDRANSTKFAGWYESTTARLYNGTTDVWLVDMTTGAATLALTNGAWANVTGGIGFSNSWVDLGGSKQVLRYRKNILGNVELQGWIKSGTLGTTVCTLPVGLRPPADVAIPAFDGGNVGCAVQVLPTGVVQVVSGNTAYIGINTQFSTI